VLRALFAARDSVCSQPECIHDIWSEQIRVTEGERLGQSAISGFEDFQCVLHDIVGRRAADTVYQIPAKHGMIRVSLVVDLTESHVIVFNTGNAIPYGSAGIRRPRQLAYEFHGGLIEL